MRPTFTQSAGLKLGRFFICLVVPFSTAAQLCKKRVSVSIKHHENGTRRRREYHFPSRTICFAAVWSGEGNSRQQIRTKTSQVWCLHQDGTNKMTYPGKNKPSCRYMETKLKLPLSQALSHVRMFICELYSCVCSCMPVWHAQLFVHLYKTFDIYQKTITRWLHWICNYNFFLFTKSFTELFARSFKRTRNNFSRHCNG